MTIAQALKKHSDVEADLLLAHALKVSKEFLYLHPEKIVSAAQGKRFEKMVKERARGVPAAYLLGYKYFYGLKFKVNRSVLIPRPESEWLVDKVLRKARDKNKTPRRPQKILDLGTGSGCLAIAIAKGCLKKMQVKIFATDVSRQALTIAKRNAKSLGANVKFLHSNLLSNVRGKFDIIVANLPYVPKTQYSKLKTDLRFEPKIALMDPNQDFGLYGKLLSQLADHVYPQATIFLEIDPTTKSFILKWRKKNKPQAKLGFARDLHGLVRYCTIRY
jgi:release factor glutamine methyltransferase